MCKYMHIRIICRNIYRICRTPVTQNLIITPDMAKWKIIIRCAKLGGCPALVYLPKIQQHNAVNDHNTEVDITSRNVVIYEQTYQRIVA